MGAPAGRTVAAMHIVILILTAGLLGFLHSVLPDHWVPLAVVARTNRWSIARTARVSFLASLGHVVTSVGIGLLIAAVGLQFRATVERRQDQIVGAILMLTGVGFLIWALTGHGHHHHDHHDGHDHDHDHAGHAHPHPHVVAPDAPGASPFQRLAGIVVPFGAAASPDLTFLPVLLAGSTIGIATAGGVLVGFALATFATFVGLTVLATLGGYQVNWPWLEEYGNHLTAAVLLGVGLLIFLHVI